MKNIWIVNQYAGSPQHGMEYRHYYLARELSKLGCDVNIITGSFSHLYAKQPATNGEFTFGEIDGIRYCWVNVPEYQGTGSFGRIKNMWGFAKKLKKLPIEKLLRPNAIIVSSPSLFPVKIVRRFCDRFGAKMIFEVRDIWPLTLCELGNISRVHPLILYIRRFEKFGYKRADKVVSLLPGAKDHFVNSGMSPEKFRWIPNGIFIEQEKNDIQSPGIMEELQRISNEKFIVGYAGTLGVSNALENLIEASVRLKENKRIHFVIVGDGGEKEKLQRMAKENVTFFASVKKEQVQMVLQKFSVCYIGWHKQSLYRFGISANKIYDYMFSGRPIIHAVEAFNDPVAENNCGWSVVPDNPGVLADAVDKASKIEGDELNRKGKNGHDAVLEKYAYGILAKKYLSIISE